MKKFARCIAAGALTAALVGAAAAPAHASSTIQGSGAPGGNSANWAITTGASSSDGLLIAAVDKTSAGGLCVALVNGDTGQLLGNVVDCNADGQNAASVLSVAPGTRLSVDLCAGYYWAGVWTAQYCGYIGQLTPPA